MTHESGEPIMKPFPRRIYPFVVALAAFGLATTATAQDDGWTYSLTPYGWFASLDGQLTVRGRTADVDVSASDLLDDAELAGAVHFEAHRGKWLILADGFFFGSGQTTAAPSAEVDVDSFLGELAVGYRVRESFAVTAGGRITSLDARIDFRGPIGILVEGDQDWFDPVIGFRAGWGAPGRGFGALVVGNVGGFGVGSDFSWNFSAFLLYNVAPRASVVFGFRVLDVDYEEEDDGFRYDLQQRGPLVGLTFHF